MAETVRVLLVGGSAEVWREVLTVLGGEGYVFETVELSTEVEPVDVAARAKDTVTVVDLSADLFRGIETVSACRRSAPSTPVVAVAENPSVDLARSIRAAGVFYLAVHPVTVDEMRTILENALQSLGRNKPSASTCRTKKRVLVVDDDDDFRASVIALLEGEGYAVVSAASAKEGLERLKVAQPDLIVLDIIMEDDWAGYAMNQAVKFGQQQHLPILMVSSIQNPPQAAFPTAGEAAMITPDVYMTKPLDIPAFLANVRRLVARSGDRSKR
jgi:CheY-like chemotaxis protein